jgi:DNA-binding NarL/FixJ family response regulator
MSKKPPRKIAKHRVFLVDDHPIVLTGFTLMLNAQPDIEVCGIASSAEEGVQRFLAFKPDLIITDITLPGRSGLDFLKDIIAMKPAQRVLMVSMHDELLYAERAIRAGARGFLMKEAGSEKMLAAIRHVLSGNIYVSDRIQAKILNAMHAPSQRASASPVDKLSDREFEVFRLLGEGRTTKEIADQLHLSGKTVAVHRGHIKEKLEIKSATELMHTAVRWVEANR